MRRAVQAIARPTFAPHLGGPLIIWCAATAAITPKPQVIEYPENYPGGGDFQRPHQTTDWAPRPHHIAARRRTT